MLYATFKKIGGLELMACFMDVGLEDSTSTEPLGMVRYMMINIDVFDFEIDVIVTNDNKGQDVLPTDSGKIIHGNY
jgi:hypothetical protein